MTIAYAHQTIGPVLVELRRIASDPLLGSWRGDATASAGPGGKYTVDTRVVDCERTRGSYFRTSGRWLPNLRVWTTCSVR